MLASGSAEHSRPGDTRMIPTIDASDIETHQLARTQGPVSRPGQGKARALAHRRPERGKDRRLASRLPPDTRWPPRARWSRERGLNHLVERLLGDAQSALQAFDLERCLHTARGREVVGAAYDLEGNEPFVTRVPTRGGQARPSRRRPSHFVHPTDRGLVRAPRGGSPPAGPGPTASETGRHPEAV